MSPAITHIDAGAFERGIEFGERRVAGAGIRARRVFRMAGNDHRELAARAFERLGEPGALPLVDRAPNAGIDRDQGEIGRLDFEEGTALTGDPDAVELAQPSRLIEQPIDPAPVRAGQMEVGFGARRERRAGRFRFEKIGVEPFERIEPVVIAGDRVDRLGESLERQIEIVLVVLHGAGRIDDVRRDDEELHVVPPPDIEIAIDQRVLRCVALAGIADDDEAEVAVLDPGGVTRNRSSSVAAIGRP